MKTKLLTLLALITLTFGSYAQAPGSIKYQAVLRNTSNTVMNNQTVDMQFTIYNSSMASVWSQTYNVTSNAYGLVNLDLGPGLDAIAWDSDTYTIETAVDFQDGNGLTVMGTSPILSVPYALHAATATSATTADIALTDNVDDADNDPTNELQTIVSADANNAITAGSDGGAYYMSTGGTDNDWTISGSDMYSGVAGNVGIGIMTPTQPLHVTGNILGTGNVYSNNTSNTLFRGASTPYWNTFYPNPACTTCNGVGIENSEVESGGFWANGNVATIWSPGDDYILRIYDEDGFPTPAAPQAYLSGGSGVPADWYAGTYNAISDMRIKENFCSINSPLDRLLTLNTYQYDIREDLAFGNEIRLGKEITEEQRNMLKNQLGFKAQELKDVFPEVVHYSEGFGLYTVNYDMMVPVLVEGIKEQQTMIDTLETENESLKKKLLELEERLNALENE